MSIQAWLGDRVSKADFVAHHYGKTPYSQAGGATDLCHLGSWDTLGHILADPEADVMVVRHNQRNEGARPRCKQEALELSEQGYTVLVRHAERHDAGLAELAAGFAADFNAPIDLHMYATPAGHYGFGWHYDHEEVFILQTAGSKEYSLRKNTVHPWPLQETMPRDMRYGSEIMPLMRCQLNAGDWLYIPAGYWHKADAQATSLSLAVGVLAPAAIDLLDRLRQQLPLSLLWRQRLPVCGQARACSREELVEQYRTICQQLADDLARRLLQESWISDWIDDAARAEI